MEFYKMTEKRIIEEKASMVKFIYGHHNRTYKNLQKHHKVSISISGKMNPDGITKNIEISGNAFNIKKVCSQFI